MSIAGVGVLAEESVKEKFDESGFELADVYACIGGDFVGCLRSSGFECDPCGQSYMCTSSHSAEVVFRVTKDADNEWTVLSIPNPQNRLR